MDAHDSSASSVARAEAGTSGPFRLDQGGDLRPLRRALEAAGYTEEAVSQMFLGGQERAPIDAVAVMRRTATPTPLNTLVRLFVLGKAVTVLDAQDALAPANLDDLQALGLLLPDPEGLRAVSALMPADDLLLARDLWFEFLSTPVPRDYVLGVGPASRLVSYLTVRRRGERALDLGTGCGFLAFLAARHGRQVTGSDINSRALNFARFNARLNEVANVDFCLGSLFEPVADQTFDLIMANPPFVISPKAIYEYRDSGMVGDALSQQVIRQAPQHLSEGGYCTVLFNWHHRNADDWAERPTEWVTQCGCDAWLTCFESRDPLTYAASWLQPDLGRDPARYAETLEQWLDFYRQMEIGLISYGAIVLRRRAAAVNWVRADVREIRQPTRSAGAQIERIFAAEDFLQGLAGDADFLHATFRLTPDHQLQQTLHADAGRWVVRQAEFTQTTGYPFVGQVDRLVSTLLLGCDGTRTLGRLAADLATEFGLEPDRVAHSAVSVMKTLLRLGFLIPVVSQPDGIR